MKTRIILIFAVLFLSGCGVSQADYDKLQAENATLKKQLDELRYGADRIIAQVNAAYARKDFATAKLGIQNLHDKHPESPENAEFKVWLAEINAAEANQQAAAAKQQEEAKAAAAKRAVEMAKEKAKADAAEQERVRIAGLNSTGIWRLGHFVDKFGEVTKDKYFTNDDVIVGKFSNTATEDSPLGVKFIISSRSSVCIQLYEYNGSNPLKATSSERYDISMRDKDGVEHAMNGTLYGDRIELVLNGIDAQNAFHAAMAKGGVVKFNLIEYDRRTSTYQFSIASTRGYQNALRLLTETSP